VTLSDLVKDFRANRVAWMMDQSAENTIAFFASRVELQEKMTELSDILDQAASNSCSWDHYQTDRDTARDNDKKVMGAIQELDGVLKLVLVGEL
jgi:uncharacterized protein YfcZ (UPF0381/DUF406 family)